MMADAVESAGRAIDPEPSKIDNLINRLINERIADGQFADAPISMAELTVIKRVFISQIASFRHRRIQYDTGKESRNGQN
jgi:membrane-associated HD superfamily phosphohydrolase